MSALLDAITVARESTPHLAEGFLINVTVAAGATLGGLVLGTAALFLQRLSRPTRWLSRAVEEFIAHSPTFILLILFIDLIPKSVTLGGVDVAIPAVPIAILALALSGGTYFSGILRGIDDGCEVEAGLTPEVLATATCNCALIMLMASGTVSYVGVPDVVDRAIGIIDAHGAELSVTLVIFAWVMLWFVGVSAVTQRLVAFGLSHYRAGSRLHIRAMLRRSGAKGAIAAPMMAMPRAPEAAGDAPSSDEIADANVALLRGVAADRDVVEEERAA